MKKKLLFSSLIIFAITTSCKNESAADKITDADIKALEVEKALAGKFPKIEFDKSEHDFGNINEGDKVSTNFVVKNIGEADLVIAEAKGSCGCTVAQPPKDPIAPGGSAPIEVIFDSNGKPGEQSKTVTLTTNTELGKEIFTIKANVKPKAGSPAKK